MRPLSTLCDASLYVSDAGCRLHFFLQYPALFLSSFMHCVKYAVPSVCLFACPNYAVAAEQMVKIRSLPPTVPSDLQTTEQMESRQTELLLWQHRALLVS